MFTKINDYKEVIIFYILLALILCFVSYHNKQIDMHLETSNNYIAEY